MPRFKNVAFLAFDIPPGAVNGAQHDPRIGTIVSISTHFPIDEPFRRILVRQVEEKSPGEDGSLLARLLQRPCGEGSPAHSSAFILPIVCSTFSGPIASSTSRSGLSFFSVVLQQASTKPPKWSRAEIRVKRQKSPRSRCMCNTFVHKTGKTTGIREAGEFFRLPRWLRFYRLVDLPEVAFGISKERHA